MPAGRFSSNPVIQVTLDSSYDAGLDLRATGNAAQIQITAFRADGGQIANGQALAFNLSVFEPG